MPRVPVYDIQNSDYNTDYDTEVKRSPSRHRSGLVRMLIIITLTHSLLITLKIIPYTSHKMRIVQICPMVGRLTKLLSTLEECRLHNSRDRFMSSPHFLTSLDLHALMHYKLKNFIYSPKYS